MPTASSSSIAGALRALVRQLAAAVYVEVAYALLVGYVAGTSYGPVALQAALVFVAGLLLGRIVIGPLWTTGLTGLFVAVLDLVIAWAAARVNEQDVAWTWGVGLQVGLLVGSGLLGALLGRHRTAVPPEADRALDPKH